MEKHNTQINDTPLNKHLHNRSHDVTVLATSAVSTNVLLADERCSCPTIFSHRALYIRKSNVKAKNDEHQIKERRMIQNMRKK